VWSKADGAATGWMPDDLISDSTPWIQALITIGGDGSLKRP
jgi:hypothetical protein